MRPRFILIAAAVAAPLIATSLAGAATNLITNGTFDNDINGWFTGQGQPVSIAHEAGRMKVTNFAAVNYETHQSGRHCVAINDHSGPYKLQAEAYVSSGQASEGWAKLAIWWYPTADCSGAAITGHLSFNGNQKDTWQTISVQDPVPANANSAGVALISVKPKPAPGAPLGGDHIVLFDNASFGRLDPPQQPPQLPEPESISPAVPQGPIDIVIPGPLGNAPDPVKPSGPSIPEQPSQPANSDTPSQPQQPQQPLQPLQPQQPQQPEHPEQPQADVPAAQPDAPAAAAGGAPLPPSTGTGLAPRPGQPVSVAGAAAALIACAGVVYAFASWRPRRH